MTREEQRRRDEQIALARVLGVSEIDAAARFGVDERTVRRAYKRWKDGAFHFEDFDPVAAIEEHIIRLDCIVSDLAVERTSRRNSASVRIQAMLAQSRIWVKKLEVLMEVGVVPRLDDKSEAWRQEHAGQIHAWLRSKARREGLPGELADWLAEGIEDWVKRAPKGSWSDKADTFTHEGVRPDENPPTASAA